MKNKLQVKLRIRWPVLVLAVLLFLQMGLILFYGSRKAGFHEDEIYMFEYANNPTRLVRNSENYYETWKDGEFYRNSVIPSEENRFHFQYSLNNKDLSEIYLCVLHASSSLFPQLDLKWLGLIPNLLFSMISTVLLYCIALALFEEKFGLIVCFAWVVNIGMLTNAMLIRPYMMLTALTLWFVYLHIQAFNQVCRQASFRIRTLILLALNTLIAVTTHYYFLIICLFICGFFTFYLLGISKYRLLGQYVLAEASVPIIVSPSILSILSNDTRTLQQLNNEAGDWEKIKTTLSLISRGVWNGWTLEFLVIIAVIAAVYFINQIFFRISVAHEPGSGIVICRTTKVNRDWHISYSMIIVLVLAIAAAGYTLIVAKIEIWQVDRYFFCIYPLILLVICTLLNQTLQLLIKQKAVISALLLCVICGVSFMAFLMQGVGYLYENFAGRSKVLSEYREYPVIIMSVYPTKPERYIPEYMEHQKIFRCQNGRYNGIAAAAETEDLSDGFLLYVVSYGDSEGELFSKINESYAISEHSLIAKNGGVPVYFCK